MHHLIIWPAQGGWQVRSACVGSFRNNMHSLCRLRCSCWCFCCRSRSCWWWMDFEFNIFTFEITLTDTFVRSFSKAYTSSDKPWAMNGETKIVKFILVVLHGRVRRAPSHKTSRLENNVWKTRLIRMFPWMCKHYFVVFFSVHCEWLVLYILYGL